MNHPFFSIIIPVYNVQAYIARCLDSVVNQTFKDIEIIIVDDCGSDRSIEIAKEYADKDKRIKVIHNPRNLGTFHTRLEGIKNTTGEYCLFIDSDDFIRLEACEILHKKIQEDYQESGQWCDIFCFGIEFYPKTWKRSSPQIMTKTLKNEQILQHFFIKSSTPPWHICGKAYSKTLIKTVCSHIHFFLHNIAPKQTLAEDAIQSFIFMLYAKKSCGINQKLYFYADTQTSITRNFSKESIAHRIQQTNQAITFFQCIKNSTNHLYFLDTKKKLIKILKSQIELEYRYDNYFLSYPCACLKSLVLHQNWKTITRLIVYFASFGRIKL